LPDVLALADLFGLLLGFGTVRSVVHVPVPAALSA
jgi:hypothetical protein